MTGYGVADGPLNGGRIQVEVRTVNHRHFNVSLKVAPGLQALESELRLRLREGIERGHVALTLRWLEEPPREPVISVNAERARHLVTALRTLRDELALAGDVDLAFLARQPDVVTIAAADDAPVDRDQLFDTVDRAMRDVVAMRETEGVALGAELIRLLEDLDGALSRIVATAPARLLRERDRLRDAVAELAGGVALDEDRVNQEIALLADKLDVTEEVARLQAHFGACHAALTAEGAIGRQLAFLSQEVLREINTIGSKANDATIAHEVVGMKGTVEKFREQVENLE